MNYISKQFAGPVIQGFSNAVESFFNTKFMPTINYFSTLSLTSANEKHTEMIGKLLGFPRPLIQKELTDETLFKFTVSYYQDQDIGFAYTYGPASLVDGGGFTSAELSQLIKMDLNTYKSLLRLLATIRYDSKRMSLKLIDTVCHTLAQGYNYNIAWIDDNKNIAITFTGLKAYTVYVIGYILTALFDTMPSITVIKE